MKEHGNKPASIEAVQYIRGKEVPAVEFLGGKPLGNCETDVAFYSMDWWDQGVSITLKTPNGLIKVEDGDYIIKDENGDFDVVKPKIFKELYEK